MAESVDSRVARNVRSHDTVARWYQLLHREVYNITEQCRLRALTQRVVALVDRPADPIQALDVGAGRGNLTAHFLDHGCRVTAADISRAFLDSIERDMDTGEPDRLNTLCLSGKGLPEVESESVDIVACYSVLHHVPDYLGLVAEMARVLRRGGVLLIDHEWCPGRWSPSPSLVSYWRELSTKTRTRLLDYPVGMWPFLIRRGVERRWRLMRDQRDLIEGDLHVWEDDHIEWDRIQLTLKASDFETLAIEDYLCCSEIDYPAPLHRKYQNLVADARLIIARKPR